MSTVGVVKERARSRSRLFLFAPRRKFRGCDNVTSKQQQPVICTGTAVERASEVGSRRKVRAGQQEEEGKEKAINGE